MKGMNIATMRRVWLASQWVLISYAVVNMVLAWLIGLPVPGDTTHSTLYLLGDTALTPPFPLTIVWAFSVGATYSRWAWLRVLGAVVSTLIAVSFAIGEVSTFTGPHGYTGWRWDLITVSASAGIVLSVACVLVALGWLVALLANRSAQVRTQH
jgi:hypothetical protein